MKHIRPLAKADMNWGDDDPLTIIQEILKALAAIIPGVRAVMVALGAKDEEES